MQGLSFRLNPFEKTSAGAAEAQKAYSIKLDPRPCYAPKPKVEEVKKPETEYKKTTDDGKQVDDKKKPAEATDASKTSVVAAPEKQDSEVTPANPEQTKKPVE